MKFRLNFGGRRKQSGVPTVRQARKRGRGGWLLIPFGLIFAIGGGFATWFVAIDTWYNALQSRDWPEVACTIVSSEVETRRGSDSTTYRPDLSYRYTWEDREWESSRYRFINFSSGNRSWAEAIVATYSPGSVHTALVNPRDPSEAVLERELGWHGLLTFIPVLFIFVGLALSGAGVYGLRKNREAAQVRSGDSMASTELRPGALLGLPEFPEDPPGGKAELRPRHGPLARFLGMAGFAVLWNGFTWTILGAIISEGRESGSHEIMPLAILSLFALIGIAVAIAAVYYAIGFFFGPRVTVYAGSSTLACGQSWNLNWTFRRGSGSIGRLRVFLEGATEGEYTTGGGKNRSRTIDTKVFLREEIFDSEERFEIARGEAALTVPENIPHSFEAPSNRIVYTLRVEGDIRFMPNLREQYRVYVAPLPVL